MLSLTTLQSRPVPFKIGTFKHLSELQMEIAFFIIKTQIWDLKVFIGAKITTDQL